MKQLFLGLAFEMPDSEAVIAAIWEILCYGQQCGLKKNPPNPDLYLCLGASVLKDQNIHKNDLLVALRDRSLCFRGD